MTPRHIRSLIIVGALIGLLASCGGDGADTTSDTPRGTEVTDTVEPATTVDVVVTGAPAGSTDADTVALANALMSASVQANLRLPKEQADCVAVFMVDALGADTLVVDDQLVDLDALPVEAQQAAAAAIAEAIPNCGITLSSVPG